MSGEDQDLVPLGDLASRAIAAERVRPASADPTRAASRDALFGRVLTTVGVATATTAALAGAASTAKAATGAAKATSAASAATSASSAVGAVITTKAAIAIAVVAFAAGTGTGAILRGPSAPPETKPIPTVTAPVASPTPSVIAPPPIEPAPSASVTPSAAPPAPHVTTTAPSPITSDADLAAERALVDRARSALARGDTAACLEATAAHEKRYPTGRLAEERELIAIEALARDHRDDEAQARADRFRRKYPNSVFTSAINRIAPPQN